jgi:serine/threonine protein kinase
MLFAHADIEIDKKREAEPGASGLVEFGVHNPSNTKVAVKYLKDNSAVAIQRFTQENDILHELIDHTNVVIPYSRILNINGRKCYIMEEADLSLLEWLDKYPTDEDFEVKRKMLIELCKAIKSLQENGYIHRDLHEDNVMMFENESDFDPKLMDFGRSYKVYGNFSFSDDDNPGWGYWLKPPELEFGLMRHDDPNYILGDSYALGLLIITVLSYDTAANYSRLKDLKLKIKRFKKIKNMNNEQPYLTSTSYDQRLNDYLEWCEINSEWSKGWLKVDLSEDRTSEIITRIIQDYSNLNYQNRKSDINDLITTLESL